MHDPREHGPGEEERLFAEAIGVYLRAVLGVDGHLVPPLAQERDVSLDRDLLSAWLPVVVVDDEDLHVALPNIRRRNRRSARNWARTK